MTTPRHATGRAAPAAWLQVSWQRRDRHRLITAIAFVGVGITGAMAVFGLPPVDLHGPFHRIGIMDPLCGGTRAARYTTHGEWALAWKYNPLGTLTVLGAAAVTARSLVGLLTRRWLNLAFSWTPGRRRLAITVILALLVALEVRQQLRADLLMAGT